MAVHIKKIIFGIGFIFIFLNLSLSKSHAQFSDITLEGLITSQNTGESLELANVVLLNEDGTVYKGATADANGLYQINRIEPGTYIFRVSFVGYQTHLDTLQLTRNDPTVRLSVRMLFDNENLDEVTIRYNNRTADLDAGHRRISETELKRVPTPAGSGDIASYLQTLPGVISTGDRGGQLFVRGGSPSENMVLVDGQLMFQPFHIVGFFSAFPQELVTSADFYAGGFGARYIGRTSSVLDVKLRNGSLYDYGGSASVSPFLADVFFEGPMTKEKSSIVVSARRSLIEEASKQYLSKEQPLHFDSQFMKMTYNREDDGHCSLMFMRTYDRGELNEFSNESFKWNNVVAGTRCTGLSDGPISLFDVNIGVSYVNNEAGTGGLNNNRRSSASLINIDVNLTQFTQRLRFDYGFHLRIMNTNYDISEVYVQREARDDRQFGLGGYLESTITPWQNVKIQPGASLALSNNYSPSIEPRLRFSWQPRGIVNEELNAAVGVYRQALSGITDNRDAGSAFTAWITTPVENKKMEAIHAILGWRQPVGEYFSYSIEGYHKWLKNIPVSVWSSVAQFTTDLTNAEGRVYGGDVNIDFNHRAFYASVGYGYAWTEYSTRQDLFGIWFGEPVQEYNPTHDRRHKLNVQTGFDWRRFTMNVGWQYGSGLPFTRPLGFDNLIRFEDQLPNVKTEPGLPRIILEKPYNSRLPYYHRLDVSIKRSIEFASSSIDIQVGAINVYDQRNLFYFDVYTQQEIYQLPLYPYASLKLTLK